MSAKFSLSKSGDGMLQSLSVILFWLTPLQFYSLKKIAFEQPSVLLNLATFLRLPRGT